MVWIINQIFSWIYENSTTDWSDSVPAETSWKPVPTARCQKRTSFKWAKRKKKKKWKRSWRVGDIPNTLEIGYGRLIVQSCVWDSSETSFSSLFACTVSCFNYSHILTTACVLGKTTVTESVLGTDKGKDFPVVFTAFYLPLALIDSEEPKNAWQSQTSFPSQARQSSTVSFCCAATPSSAE